jgi:hypothetical protein
VEVVEDRLQLVRVLVAAVDLIHLAALGLVAQRVPPDMQECLLLEQVEVVADLVEAEARMVDLVVALEDMLMR